jgi:hypothetical protein
MTSSIRPILLFLLVAFTGCHRHSGSCSFYYWKTVFDPDSLEKQTLAYNQVNKLYIRYFDIDFSPTDAGPAAVTPITFQAPPDGQVIPVIFIRNRVFEKCDLSSIDTLAGKVLHLVASMDSSLRISTAQIQFDCDWTVKTKDRYFYFLQRFRTLFRKDVTCTIRLHQLKYPTRTGIPPVHRGVLMFYNMGDIDGGAGNSIYDPAIAARYISSLAVYPMDLDIALPIFSWGMQVRNGQVIKLLNKVNFHHFQQDSNFITTATNRYQAKTSCFSGGSYFRQGDIVKIEHIDAGQLYRMAKDIRRYSNHRLHEAIFFDLDTTNLVLYDKDVFKKTLDNLY